MQTPLYYMLLTRKIKKPDLLPNLLEMKEVNSYLSDLNKYKITLLSTPAGYGKTTALNLFFNRNAMRSVWYSLDGSDNSPQVFWHYLIHGLKSLDPSIGKRSLILIKSESQGDQHEAINYLIEELYKYSQRYLLDESIALVIDNFHEINDSVLVEQLNYFLDFLSNRFKVVISCRSQPPIQLSKRRSKGDVLEIPQTKFLLDSVSVREFYRMCKKLDVPEDFLRMAVQISGGWISVLQILSFPVGMKNDYRLNNLNKGNYYTPALYDYLESEVLNNISNKNLEFYGCFCSLLNVPEDLIYIITPNHAKDWIEQGKSLNLLTEFYEGGRRCYVLNDLVKRYFKDKTKYLSKNVKDIIQKYFLDRGGYCQLFDFGIDQKDWKLSAKGAMPALKNLIRCGEYHVGRSYLDQFPINIIRKYPALKLFEVWLGLYASGHDFVTDSTANVIDLIGSLEEANDSVRSEHGIFGEEHFQSIKAFSVVTKFQLDLLKNGVITDSRLVNDLYDSAVADSDFSQWSWNGLGANAFMQGELHDAESYLLKAIFQSKNYGDGYCMLSSLAVLGPCLLFSGKADEALDICGSVHSWCVDNGYDVSGQFSILHRVRLLIYREINDTSESKKQFIKLSECPRYIDPLNRAYHLWSEVLYFLGTDTARSRVAVNKLNTHFSQHYSVWNLGIPSPKLMRSILDVMEGDHKGIIKWAKSFQSSWIQKRNTSQQYTFELLVYCRVLLSTGRNPQQALQYLIESASSGGNLYIEIKARVLMACYVLKEKSHSEALNELADCLVLAERSKLHGCILDEKEFITDSLSNSAINILSKRKDVKSNSVWLVLMGSDSTGLPTDNGVQLTGREQEVLEYLLAGASNLEISKSLVISTATVKTHVSNILGKYRVNSRVKLMSEARLAEHSE